VCPQHVEQSLWREQPCLELDSDDLDMRRQLRWRRSSRRYTPQSFGTAVVQHPGIPGNTSVWVDDHADRRGPGHRTCRELGIIRSDRLGSDNDGVHQSA
jgi:hypothetical protein